MMELNKLLKKKKKIELVICFTVSCVIYWKIGLHRKTPDSVGKGNIGRWFREVGDT